MSSQPPPKWIGNALKIAIALILVISIIDWAGGSKPKKVQKFQGGIADPYRYSSPKPDPFARPKDPPLYVGGGPAQTPSAQAGQEGTMLIIVKDQNGVPVEGITVVGEGPVAGTFVTDDQGEVLVSGPPGYYNFSVVPACSERIQVTSGASAKAGIAEGQRGKGSLNIVWRHRYRPWHPSFSSHTPDWPIGETVELGFYVVDRCSKNERRPNAEYPTFAFRLSSNLKLAFEPGLKADPNGHGFIKIVCQYPGPASVVSYDSRNPRDDQQDLLLEELSGTTPQCR